MNIQGNGWNIAGRIGVVILLALAVLTFGLYRDSNKVIGDDPSIWEADIQALEARSGELSNDHDYVLFVGSSSIRRWRTLAEDMAPIEVVNRGFGGAKLNDLVHFSARLVNAARPCAVVIFAGTNDIKVRSAKEPAQLLRSYQAFVSRVHTDLPQLPIFYIAITPTLKRWPVWPVAQATNRLIEHYSTSDERLYFIDTGAALLSEGGTPDENNYVDDGLHLSQEGYAIWRDIIRKRLLQDLSRSGDKLLPTACSLSLGQAPDML
jgi:lysophospholipase L1-like esterase